GGGRGPAERPGGGGSRRMASEPPGEVPAAEATGTTRHRGSGRNYLVEPSQTTVNGPQLQLVRQATVSIAPWPLVQNSREAVSGCSTDTGTESAETPKADGSASRMWRNSASAAAWRRMVDWVMGNLLETVVRTPVSWVDCTPPERGPPPAGAESLGFIGRCRASAGGPVRRGEGRRGSGPGSGAAQRLCRSSRTMLRRAPMCRSTSSSSRIAAVMLSLSLCQSTSAFSSGEGESESQMDSSHPL